jgi:nucleotide-binding universal stress UspA family protein
MTTDWHGDATAPRRYLDTLASAPGADGLRTEMVDHLDDAVGAITLVGTREHDAAIVMTTHGHGRLSAPFLGSTATEVLRASAVPVVLVGPHCETDWWHDPPRVITCWGGEESNPILDHALAWSRGLGAELWVATVFHPLDTRMAADPHAEFEPALAHLGPGADVHLLPVRHDFAAGALVDSAREESACLLAMTTHARTGLARAALGSVTTDVVHNSPCPVLVVRLGD